MSLLDTSTTRRPADEARAIDAGRATRAADDPSAQALEATRAQSTLDLIASRAAHFPIDEMMQLLRDAVAPYPPAAMFELHDEGYTSIFEILVACLISIRTLDEITLVESRRLFEVARTPAEVAALDLARLEQLIDACTYPEAKAKTIHAIAVETVTRFEGKLPCDYETLKAFHGVGPKCANLVLGVSCHQAHGVAVDVHVDRVTNRWGYVAGKTPEKTMDALMKVLPKVYWIEINKLLVPFGKFICTRTSPRCSTCPLAPHCQKVGVTSHR